MRRFFRILKWCVLGLLGIVGILLTVNGIRTFRAGARLDAKIAALHAAGEPLSLADLTRQPIPPERNAETYLRRAREDARAIETEVDAADEAAPKAVQKAFEEGRPSPGMLKTMRAALEAHPQVFTLIEEASNCPDYDPQFDFTANATPFLTTDVQTFLDTFLEQIQSGRTIFRVCNYRVLVQLDEGHREEALQTCLTMFRLARLLDRNPMLIGQLVGLAVRGVAVHDTDLVLRSGPLPESAYTALEQELARQDLIETSRQALRSDRAYGMQTFREMAVFTAPMSSLFPWHKNYQCDYLDLMEKCIQDAALPYSEWKRVMDSATLSQQISPMVGTVLPALQQGHDATFRVTAQFRSLRVLNALLQREQAGGSAEPTLAELGLPPEVITDPFNDKPLHLKKLPAGWLVYSVGTNLEDDGGDLTDNLDVGVGPPLASTTTDDEETPR